MKRDKIVLLLVLMIISSITLRPQVGRIDSALVAIPSQHYVPEYDFDVPTNASAWTKQTAGLNVAFGTGDVLYFRTEVPAANGTTWQVTGWRGERLNTQILVWSLDTLQQVRFRISDLKNEKGKAIDKNDIALKKVCYVLSNYPYGAANADCGSGPLNAAYLMPDRFENFESFDLAGKTVRPVWLSVDIQSIAEPGVYIGTIQVFSGKQKASLSLRVTVQKSTLPPPHDWTFRLDLWQNPWAIADYYHVKPWSEEHKSLLKKHLKLYAEAGGKYITTYGVHSPWGGGEYYIEGGMINWIKTKRGTWTFDYNIFDEYVQLAMSVGIDKAITIYTPLPWGERFRYWDEATGNYVYERWQPTADTFKTNWNIFLTDLRKHLQQKGWFDKTYLGVNENAMDQTLSAIRVIRNHSRQWKITYAGDWHKELDTLLDDYCSVFGKEPGIEEVTQRSIGRNTSTFYICCTPPKPNTFLFSPPVEGRWLGWYAYAHHYDGFLRWAYDAWPADPMRDARYVYWPAGDCFLVYPGGNSGIRFEKLREGIVDYEKVRIIMARATKSTNKEVSRLVASLNSELKIINDEKEFKEDHLKDQISAGTKILAELNAELDQKSK